MNTLLCIFVLVLSPTVFAKEFSTSDMNFDLLHHWKCSLVKNIWTCVSKLNRQKVSEATTILTAKQKGVVDSVSHHTNYLDTSKSTKTAAAGVFQPKINYVKQRQINNYTWVDEFYTESEVPSDYTQYFSYSLRELAIRIKYSPRKTTFQIFSQEYHSEFGYCLAAFYSGLDEIVGLVFTMTFFDDAIPKCITSLWPTYPM